MLVLLALLPATIYAADSNDVSDSNSVVDLLKNSELSCSVLGNDGAAYVRLGVRPSTLTEVGIELGYTDAVSESGDSAYVGGFYATYDAIPEKQLAVLGQSVTAVMYAGVKADMLYYGDTFEATAALMTGVHFGDENIRMGMEIAVYAPNEWLGWSSITDISDDAELLAYIDIRL